MLTECRELLTINAGCSNKDVFPSFLRGRIQAYGGQSFWKDTVGQLSLPFTRPGFQPAAVNLPERRCGLPFFVISQGCPPLL